MEDLPLGNEISALTEIHCSSLTPSVSEKWEGTAISKVPVLTALISSACTRLH